MAGILGFGNFEKLGKGVDKNAPTKKRFFFFFELYFRKFWKLIQLNLLFVLCCIPIVTIGPAISAFTKVMRDITQEKPIFLLSDFFEAFRNNWKQSFILSVLEVVVGAFLGFAIYYYYSHMTDPDLIWMMIPFVLCVCLATFVIAMHYYLHLLIVTVNLKLPAIIKNAYHLSVLGMKSNICTTLFIVLLCGFPLILTLIGFSTIATAILLFTPFILVLIGFSTIGFIVCFNSFQHIQKYVIDPYYAKLEEEKSEYSLDNTDDNQSVFTDIGTTEIATKVASSPKGKIIS